MLGEPLLAHPAKSARVDAASHSEVGDDYNRDQHDNDADDGPHIVLDLAPPRSHRTDCTEGIESALFLIAQQAPSSVAAWL